MEINERIREIVKALGITQTEFSQRLKLSQQYVSLLTRTGVPSDRTIRDICDKFNVNEKWIRTGEGKMFEHKTDEENLQLVFNQMMETNAPYRNKIIRCLCELSPEEWKIFGKKLLEIGDAIRSAEGEEGESL